MTSVASRQRSQPSFKGAYNSQLLNRSPGAAPVKSRVIYKNAKEDETNDKRSLYMQSYGRNPQMNASAQAFNSKGLKNLDPQRLTLADIGSQIRPQTSKANSIAPKSRDSQREEVRSPKGLSFAAAQAKSPNQTGSQSMSPVKGGKTQHEVNQKCYESQLLKDQMTKAFCDHPYVNVDNEAEYYDAVKRLDVCGRCWAAQQKYYSAPFKIKHKGPGQSLYKRDFVEHPLGGQGPVLKNDFYTTLQNNVPMDFGTTMKNDYKAWNVGPVKKETMDFKPATTGIPFAGNSNYRSQYVNWGPNEIAHQKAPNPTTIIPELPFNGKTSYGENFTTPEATNQPKPVNRNLSSSKSPLTPAIPFLGESTNAATYKPFKVANVPEFGEPEKYEPTLALPEHQRSLYARDFPAPNQWKCPAVIFMEQNPHPKFKHL